MKLTLRIVAASMLVAMLAACTPQMQDELTRDAARTAVRPVLEQRFPGIPLEPATDCVIDNASSSELLALAADAVTGPTANTVEIVSDVVSRPATIECLAREGLPALLTRL
ncbi:hypothetical protein [Silicimonas sp. MF1-12-2]|jgi:hypothetical protein|uniref:hypothetical protein n=1 Tax=Silicimonas sp. MF1-12-2 TaxID=3384793 RepID=UPI0039B4097C